MFVKNKNKITSDLIRKRLKKYNAFEQGIWQMINTYLLIMSVFAYYKKDPIILWVSIIFVFMLLLPRITQSIKSKRLSLLGNNLAFIPENWQKYLKKLNNQMSYLRFCIMLAFALIYFLPNSWPYVALALLYGLFSYLELDYKWKSNQLINDLDLIRGHQKDFRQI